MVSELEPRVPVLSGTKQWAPAGVWAERSWLSATPDLTMVEGGT